MKPIQDNCDGYLLSDNRGFPIADHKMPSDVSGFVKSILDNAKDLEKECYPKKHSDKKASMKDPVIVIETGNK